MPTFNIPLTTLPVGSHDFGPTTAADADKYILVTIDRTVAGGLNATAAATIEITAFQSNDGGVSFFEIGGTECLGGAKAGRFGNIDNITLTLQPGISRQVKANVTVIGSSVAVAGTIVTQ